MTFGEVKSIIEESLIESYKDSKNFKSVMKEFHTNILTNKSLSKLYSLYDDLNSEKSLSEKEAKEYLEEGISLIRSVVGLAAAVTGGWSASIFASSASAAVALANRARSF